MKCGTVLLDDKYQFPTDGGVINKILIYLCPYGYNYLVVPTTTKQRFKQNTPGCQAKDRPPNFFIPAGTCWLDQDSWIELDTVNEYHGYEFDAKVEDKVLRVLPNTLPSDLMKQIISCILLSEDVDEVHLEFLSRVHSKL